MISILRQWNGRFEVDGEVYLNIDDTNIGELEDEETFDIRLLPKVCDGSDTAHTADIDTRGVQRE